ncbi:MAG: PQQ-binding-like beta-propeller repeat protein [Acidobacteriota bacterium]
MKLSRFKWLAVAASFLLIVSTASACFGGGGSSDWPDWRGPGRDGISPETDLPESWSPDGENLAWTAPYGGLSTPIVLGDRLYLQNGAGEGKDLQERVLSLDANTGELIWEYRFNVSLSDVPPRRVGWASPAGDPDTGNVYAFGIDGTLLALSPEGDLLWQRYLPEDFGLITTHGGRTVSPLIESGYVIVSALSSGWGALAPGRHRFFAFDKANGDLVWLTTLPGPPFDTTYSPPIVVDRDGMRLMITGGSDGAVHALQVNTGKLVWRYPMSKRGINSGVVLRGDTAIVSHGEENLRSSEMGYIAAIDTRGTGDFDEERVKWAQTGHLGGYSSPVFDGDRIYQVDNSSNLVAFDIDSGEKLWTLNLGTLQRASPVLADGKLYVGSQNGTFYILRPSAQGAEILDKDEFSTEQHPVQIRASVAVAHGRIYLVTSEAIYAIGRGTPGPSAPVARAGRAVLQPSSSGTPVQLQVIPEELAIAPGDTVQLQLRSFDANGNLIHSDVASEASWSMAHLEGEFEQPGMFVASAEAIGQAGQVTATLNGVSGDARLRVIPPLPWQEDFSSLDRSPPQWINAGIKFEVRDVGGNKVYVKKGDNPFLKRARVYMGPSDWSDMAVEADVRSVIQRRRMGDIGVIAQRYALILFGSKQTLELQSWQTETTRTVSIPFSWRPDTWYRMKLRVENLPDGGVRVLGKIWPVNKSEPVDWTLERSDPHGDTHGSPGIYADAHAEVMFDNLKVTSNR